MRKLKLKSGETAFGIKIEHFVTRSVFAKAIASYYWPSKQIFDPSLSKKEVIKILEHQLFFQGIEGLYTGHWDAASEEFQEPFIKAYDAALEWIDKNYPYLAGQPG